MCECVCVHDYRENSYDARGSITLIAVAVAIAIVSANVVAVRYSLEPNM